MCVGGGGGVNLVCSWMIYIHTWFPIATFELFILVIIYPYNILPMLNGRLVCVDVQCAVNGWF